MELYKITKGVIIIVEIQKRTNYMDIMKGLAIITVVMGHCGATGCHIIVLFHMALFFFISGYFYKEKYSESPLNLLKKRLISLYLPFIKYEILFLILHNLFCKIGFYSTQANVVQNEYTISNIINNVVHILLFDGTEVLVSPLWFLASLFIVTMLFCLISFLTKNIKFKELIRGLVIITLFIVGNYLTNINLNIKNSLFAQEIFNAAFVALLFFYIGFIYRKIERRIPMNILIAIESYIILYVCAESGFVIDMRINYYPSIVMFLINSILGIYLMVYLSKKIDKVRFEFNLLKYIGRNTIIIMALHSTCFKLAGLLQIAIYKLPMYKLGNFGATENIMHWWALYVLVGVFVPIVIQYLIIDKVSKLESYLHRKGNCDLGKIVND